MIAEKLKVEYEIGHSPVTFDCTEAKLILGDAEQEKSDIDVYLDGQISSLEQADIAEPETSAGKISQNWEA